MAMHELISIIIPTYNRAGILRRAIESCCRQYYGNIEILVIDDASVDRTKDAALELSKHDCRVKYFRNETNLGLSASLNNGIFKSNGVFATFLDDDCELLPETISLEYKIFKSLPHGVNIMAGNMFSGSRYAKTIYPSDRTEKTLDMHDVLAGNYWMSEQSTWFGRRSFFAENLFDVTLRNHMDMDLQLRVLGQGEKIFFYNRALRIKHNVNGMSTVSFDKITIKETFLKKHLAVLAEHRRYLSRLYYCLGKDRAAMNDLDHARKNFWLAFKLNPSKLDYLLKVIIPMDRVRNHDTISKQIG